MARPQGMKHSEEARALMSEKRKARPPETPEQKEKRITAIRNSLANKPLPESQKEKIRQSVLNTIAQNGRKGVFKMTQGEQQIADFFKDLSMTCLPQYPIVEGGHLYDFYVPVLNLLIEFDGSHHWHDPWMFSNEQKKVSALRNFKRLDESQTAFAQRRGYNIVRIFGKNRAGDSYHGTLEEQMIRAGYGNLVIQRNLKVRYGLLAYLLDPAAYTEQPVTGSIFSSMIDIAPNLQGLLGPQL